MAGWTSQVLRPTRRSRSARLAQSDCSDQEQATNQKGTSVVATKSNHDRCFRFYSPAPFVESIDRAIALKTDPVRRERLASLKGTNVYAARWLVANAQNEKAGAVAPVTKPATTSDLGHKA